MSRTVGEVAELIDLFREFLDIDDDGHVWFALAVATSAAMSGDPLWGMIIGPPSGGKTEAIRMLKPIARDVDELTAPALLSWSKAKRDGAQKPVGILADLPGGGLVTIGDFSTVLATSDKGGRDQLFSLLRRAYDGAVTRDLGNAPAALRWEGRLTILTGCTPAIDNYSSYADALGPRWVYYRQITRDSKSKRAMAAAARREDVIEPFRAKAAELATGIVHAAQRQVKLLDTIPEDLARHIDDAAIVACYGRGAVPRNGYGKREIEGLPIVEEPARLTRQLLMLTRALLALGMDADTALALMRRCALGSMPQVRLFLLDHLIQFDSRTASDLARAIGCDRKVARMACEDLATIGLVTALFDDDEADARPTAPRPWAVAANEAELLDGVLTASRYTPNFSSQAAAEELGTKRGNPTPQPPKITKETEGPTGALPTIRPKQTVTSHGSSQADGPPDPLEPPDDPFEGAVP